MLKSKIFYIIAIMALLLNGCVQTEVRLPSSSQNHRSNFINNDTNSWAEQTNEEEEENIDISDIDQELSETDMTTLENSDQKVARIPFPINEYNKLARSGKGTIEGDIYLIDLYGEKVYGKDTRLYLNPITSYSNQWYKESYIKGKKMTEPDSRLFNYLRFTASDSNGHFAFYGVPSGSYYLIGTVTCGSQCGYDTPKSIRVATKVKVTGNQVVQKDLYRQVNP
jgi:hypothetical protein